MYIISKRKDYYDGVAGTTGIDKTIVYEREIIEVENDDLPKVFQKYSPWKNRNPSPFVILSGVNIKRELRISKVYVHAAPFIIGFCGKLYVGWKLYSEGKQQLSGTELVTTITYDNENIKKILNQMSWHGKLDDNLNYILTYDALPLFRELNTPVFVYDSDYGRSLVEKTYRNNPKFFINPLLKEYQFFKVFDSFQAFQEIQMFISGVLGNKEKDIVQVEDKYKIAQHGFDKWSFRKEPENN